MEDNQNTLEFPEVLAATVDIDFLRALFHDIQNLTRVLCVIPKLAMNEHVPETSIPLDEAGARLLNGDFRGIQIRYIYQNEEWWDTILHSGNEYKITRIKQEFK